MRVHSDSEALPWPHQVDRGLSEGYLSHSVHSTDPATINTTMRQRKTTWTSYFGTYRIILECCHISLNCLLHLASGNKGSCQIDVAINEVWFQTNSVSVVFQCLLQLAPLLEDIAEVAVRLGEERVLFNSQCAEVGRSENIKIGN
jgi:hypothetical protein